MMASVSVRFRVVLLFLVSTVGLVLLTGCSGGWGDAKPAVTVSKGTSTPAVTVGGSATFSVSPAGTGPFTYQWYVNGVAIPGATASAYTTGATTGNQNGSVYTVVVSDAGGSTTSAPFVLTVNTPPSIAAPPASQTVIVGQATTFTVSPAGTAPFSYQWYLNGTPISGATASSYTTPATTALGTSAYTVQVTNVAGTVTSAAGTLTVNPIVPTLAFGPIGSESYGGAAFPVSATSASSGAVTYSVVSGPATIAGNMVTVTGAGAVVLSASQAANGNYAAATATTTFTVSTEVPTLKFGAIGPETYGGAPFTVSASSASSGAITYSVVSGPATVVGNKVTITGAGPVVLSASQAASGNYAAGSATTTINVATEVPTLTFGTIAPQTYGGAAFPVTATSASSGAVTYSVVSGPATVAGNLVTITGAGAVVLSASQAANGNYAAATATTTFTVATEVPTLTFGAIGSKTYGGAAFTVSATSASSGAVTYTVVSGPATVAGNTVTMTGAGAVVLSASQAAEGNYAAGTATTTFTISPEVPTLTFGAIGTETYGGAAFAVSATSASTGAVTYTVVSGPATVAGDMVTMTGVGPVVLSATQAANGNYAIGTATTTFTISPEVPTLTFGTIAPQTYGGAAFAVSATSASTGTLTYSIVSGPATIVGNMVTATGAGTVVLSASQAAAGNYAAGTATTSITVAQEVPTLTFEPIGSETYGGSPFGVNATSVSSGAVTYTVVSGPATIAGNVVTITGAGTVVLGATQAASGNYAAATAQTSFTVAPEVPTLTFAAISSKTYGAPAFAVSATSASTGAVTYTVLDGPATVAGNMVTVNGVGTVVLSASQVASGNYAAASTITTFTVVAQAPTLIFAAIGSKTYGTPAFVVSATSASSGGVTYSVASGPATVAGNTVTITGAGTVVLNASQVADGNYTSATAATTFTVAPEVPILTFGTIPPQTYGGAPFAVSATSASSGGVTYSVASGPATVVGNTVTITERARWY